MLHRSVAYHNWSHGFHVCNSIYSILKASPGIFTPVEVSSSDTEMKLHHLDTFFNFRAWASGWAPSATTWTTVATTTSS